MKRTQHIKVQNSLLAFSHYKLLQIDEFCYSISNGKMIRNMFILSLWALLIISSLSEANSAIIFSKFVCTLFTLPDHYHKCVIKLITPIMYWLPNTDPVF